MTASCLQGWRNQSQPVAVNATLKTIVQPAALRDGRAAHLHFHYGDARTAGVYSVQPFFQYNVCFLYPLPGTEQHSPETFEQALEVVWCPNGLTTNDGCLELYNRTAYAGRSEVAGAPCTLWRYVDDQPPVTVQGLRHHFGPSLRDIWALYHATHAVWCALLGVRAHWMRIGA